MREKLELLRRALMKQARGGGKLKVGLFPVKRKKTVGLVPAH